MKDTKSTPPPTLENKSRRKAVKTIVGGVTALAAYNVMPVKWGTPIIEQVFLPAHAATSGTTLHDPCTVTHEEEGDGTDTFLVTGYVTPPTEGLPATIVLTPSLSGTNLTAITATTTTLADGTFSATIVVTGENDRVDVTTTVEGADGSASCFSVKPEEDPELGPVQTFINSSSVIITITTTPTPLILNPSETRTATCITPTHISTATIEGTFLLASDSPTVRMQGSTLEFPLSCGATATWTDTDPRG